MTNNEIIIDGVNVAECEFIDNGEVKNACKLGYWTDVLDYTPNCVNNKKCVFKKLALQLQRAKAELEQYKASKQASYESMQAEWNKAINELKDVKTENEKLKEKIDSCNDEFGCEEMVKYHKALEEIKNNCVEILATIAEEGKPNHSIVDTIWCKNIPCCTLWELVEGMQREINEVLK